MMNVVIPMAGLGSRFSSVGYKKPKPFIDVLGKPMIKCVLENLAIPDAKYILIGRKDHLESEQQIVQSISEEFNATFIPIDKLTEGTACTVLFARKYINNDKPLLIANSDQLVDIDINDFVQDCFDRDLDGSILTFKDNELNPKWSFAKVNKDGIVSEVQEKKAISDRATVGIYLFTKGRYFVDSAVDMIVENERVNNEFYTCPVYNYGIKDGLGFGIFDIPYEGMHGIGTPEDLDKYLLKIANG